MVFNFNFNVSRTHAAAPAIAAGGSGAYVVGALAVGGIAGALGYSEYSDEINAHAKRVWDGTTQLVKDSWNATVNWMYDLPMFAINNPDVSQHKFPTLEFPLSTTNDLVKQTVINATPNIIQSDYLKNATSVPVAPSIVTKYPNVSIDKVYEHNSSFGLYTKQLIFSFTDEKYFLLKTTLSDMPYVFKTMTLSQGSYSGDWIYISISDYHASSARFNSAQQQSFRLKIYSSQLWEKGLLTNVLTAEMLLGLLSDGAINDIYIGDESIFEKVNLARSLNMTEVYRDFPGINAGTNTGRLTIPFPEGKLGVPVGDLPAGSDVVYNPGDSTWYTPDGTLVGNPSDVIAKPFPNTKVIDHPITGVPTLVWETPWGAVNVGTGELITTGNPPVPGGPGGNPNVPNLPRPPVGVIGFLSLFLDFFRAVLMYLVRLFTFISSLAFLPPVSIGNSAFDYFRHATFYGVNIWQIVMMLFNFGIGLAIYKTIKSRL